MAATDFLNARHNLQLPDFPVKNTGGTALAFGTVVKIDASNLLSGTQPQIGVIATAALTDVPFGVVIDTSIAAGGQGRVQVLDGTAVWCFVDAAGNITGGQQVMPSSTVSGAVRPYVAAAGNSSVGQALTSTAASADPVLVKLHMRGPAT